MKIVRRHGIPTTVVACSTDTLVTAAHCRQVATLLGASYRELALEGGHMWMLLDWGLLERELADPSQAVP
jgi:surfactin synthase thioesterase subunit